MVLVALVGCGPAVGTDGDEGGTTGSASSTASPGTTVTSAAPTISATGEPPTSTVTTASPTTAATVVSEVTTDATTGSLPMELAGVITRVEFTNHPVLEPCDFEDVCLVNIPLELSGCTGVYLAATGQVVAQGNGFIPSSCIEAFDFIVDEITEMRPCVAEDCDGDPACEPVSCVPVLDCAPFGTECDEGTTCKLRQGGPELPFWLFQCWPVDGSELELGDACTAWTPDSDGVDDCGPGLHCRPSSKGAADGTCAAICDPGGDDCNADDCAACDSFDLVGLCVPLGEGANGAC